MIRLTDLRVPNELLEAAPTNMADIAAAVEWVKERRAEGKKRLLIMFRDLDLPSPGARHQDNDAFVAAMNEKWAGDWYCLTTRHIGYVDAETDAVYCCDGVWPNEVAVLARLAPTWTMDGRAE